jgi:hypothetical protein
MGQPAGIFKGFQRALGRFRMIAFAGRRDRHAWPGAAAPRECALDTSAADPNMAHPEDSRPASRGDFWSQAPAVAFAAAAVIAIVVVNGRAPPADARASMPVDAARPAAEERAPAGAQPGIVREAPPRDGAVRAARTFGADYEVGNRPQPDSHALNRRGE